MKYHELLAKKNNYVRAGRVVLFEKVSPDEYFKVALDASQLTTVPPEIIAGIAMRESKQQQWGNTPLWIIETDVVGKAGERGPMQLSDGAIKDVLNFEGYAITNPFDLKQAFIGGGYYLKILRDRLCNGDLRCAIAAYNLGWGNMRTLLAKHPDDWWDVLDDKVKAYVNEVLQNAQNVKANEGLLGGQIKELNEKAVKPEKVEPQKAGETKEGRIVSDKYAEIEKQTGKHVMVAENNWASIGTPHASLPVITPENNILT